MYVIPYFFLHTQARTYAHAQTHTYTCTHTHAVHVRVAQTALMGFADFLASLVMLPSLVYMLKYVHILSLFA